MKFTDRSLKALKPKEKRYEVSELNGHGFGVRVLPSGKKTFIYRYKLNGKTRGMMLGSYEPGTKYGSLAEAHKRHANARAKLKEGVDPGAIKQAKIQAEREADTVDDLAERYVELHAKKQKKTWQEDKRMLDKDVLPAWGSRKAKDIHRRDVNDLLDNIVTRGAPVVANRTLEVIRRMFNFAIERDIIDNNPCYLVKAPGKETRRDRVLNPNEIRIFWRRLYKTDMGQLVRLALKLQLVTAQRRGEVMNAKWCDIDLDGGWWTIPETKNQLSHRVALSPIAKALIRHIHRRSSDTDWLFPNPSRDAAMTERAPTRAVARNLEKLGIAHFTPHDLRRTAASQMASAGVQRLVISKVLNHVESGITAVYDRHSYDAEKRDAMNVWADRLSEIIRGPDNG
ncbi:MAG: tyrosine-type recombinase/integrase [Candidatus Thiodiazotropha taylori]|nr:tyrosine-type recombinase/integrase [Candidatus Thiodiazotropha taylori]MCW4327885.1 tyrosine-type recombinase/integrase [Candidatus Thiodiazotropha taylori]